MTTLNQPLSQSLRQPAGGAAIPWYLWASIIGVTSAMIGVEWDISWHRSIGRDTFWTPPHMAIYLCGVIAGIASAYLILATTFGKLPRVRESSVKMWGFYGPLGAFITAWGGIAMLVSAPFDDWWHSAYGLDVKILSPPHAVLALGIISIELGALMLLLGYMNRAQGSARTRLNWLYLYVGSMIVIALQVMIMEYASRVEQHMGSFYLAVALSVPLTLMGVAAGSGHRWPATVIAGMYTVFMMALVWILPRFPAEPKLGPVYNPVTQFTPPNFPLLLIVPAIAIDLLRQYFQRRGTNLWLQAVACGTVFIGLFFVAQWFFADFLMTPAAANGFFGTIYRDYGAGPASFEARNLFVKPEGNFDALLGIALASSIVASGLGLAWGNWMRRVKR
jgi:hypothetical protein